MSKVFRRALLASVGANLALAGCVFSTDSDGPDPDHPISLRNEHSKSHRVRVWVVRKSTGERIFNAKRVISAGDHVSLYNLEQAHPNGVEKFRICGKLLDSDRRETAHETCTTVKTNECYGSVSVQIERDGTVNTMYSIC